MTLIGDMWNAINGACQLGVPACREDEFPPKLLSASASLMNCAHHFELPEFMSEHRMEERHAAGGYEKAVAMWDDFHFPFNAIAVSDPYPPTPTIVVLGVIPLGIQRLNGGPRVRATGLNQTLQYVVMRKALNPGFDYMMYAGAGWMQQSPLKATMAMQLVDEVNAIVTTRGAKRVAPLGPTSMADVAMWKAASFEFVAQAVKEVIELMAIIQGPKRFVVELEPTFRRKKKSKAKPLGFTRLSERPIYISLTSPEIRKMSSVPTGRKIADHDVRAHYRVLRAERYKKARGKRVFVKAHFAGPQEGRTPEGRQYKVRLDIASPLLAGGA